jgi:hypothetical protein
MCAVQPGAKAASGFRRAGRLSSPLRILAGPTARPTPHWPAPAPHPHSGSRTPAAAPGGCRVRWRGLQAAHPSVASTWRSSSPAAAYGPAQPRSRPRHSRPQRDGDPALASAPAGAAAAAQVGLERKRRCLAPRAKPGEDPAFSTAGAAVAAAGPGPDLGSVPPPGVPPPVGLACHTDAATKFLRSQRSGPSWQLTPVQPVPGVPQPACKDTAGANLTQLDQSSRSCATRRRTPRRGSTGRRPGEGVPGQQLRR